MREWQDLRGQLRQIASGLDLTESDQPADSARIHAALASGLLSHLGLRVAESRDYLGARNVRFMIAPGSVLARKPPRWVIAAELVETHRLLARVARGSSRSRSSSWPRTWSSAATASRPGTPAADR